MAPPVEEVPTKVVKVATTVVKRQSTKTEDTTSTTPPAMDDDLHLTVLEESFRNAQSGYEGRSAVIFKHCVFLLCVSHFTKLPHYCCFCPRSEHTAGRDDETTFLSNLKSLWRGFIHMHAVAKLVTKAFPVSGIVDYLTEVKQVEIVVALYLRQYSGYCH